MGKSKLQNLTDILQSDHQRELISEAPRKRRKGCSDKDRTHDSSENSTHLTTKNNLTEKAARAVITHSHIGFSTSRGLSAGSSNLCASLNSADKPRDVEDRGVLLPFAGQDDLLLKGLKLIPFSFEGKAFYAYFLPPPHSNGNHFARLFNSRAQRLGCEDILFFCRTINFKKVVLIKEDHYIRLQLFLAEYKKLQDYCKKDIACYQHPQQEDTLVLYFNNLSEAEMNTHYASVVASIINKEIEKFWIDYPKFNDFFNLMKDVAAHTTQRNFVILNKFSMLCGFLYQMATPVWLKKYAGSDDWRDYPQMPEDMKCLFITNQLNDTEVDQENRFFQDALVREPQEMPIFADDGLPLEDELFQATSDEDNNIWQSNDFTAILNDLKSSAAHTAESSVNKEEQTVSNKKGPYLSGSSQCFFNNGKDGNSSPLYSTTSIGFQLT